MAEPINRKVLDLSHHNTVSDWNAVKAAGIVGVIHKATESTTYKDQNYNLTRLHANLNGLLWGAYHFLRPGDMQAQAKFFVATAQPDGKTLMAADHEDDRVSLSDLKVFLEEVHVLTGQRPVLYSGNVIKEQVGDRTDEYLAQHRLWLAHYSSSPSWPKQIWPAYWLWQYGDGAAGPAPHGCPGISGEVDTNSCLNEDILKASWATAIAPPVPTPVPAPLVVEVIVPEGVEVKITKKAGIA